MKLQNKRIVFDITSLTLWTRPPVGIIRTQFELAKWLLATQVEPVLFVRFALDRGSLEAVGHDETLLILNKLEQISSSESATPDTTLPTPYGIDLKNTFKSFVKKLIPKTHHKKCASIWQTYQKKGTKAVFFKILSAYAPKTYQKTNQSIIASDLNHIAVNDLSHDPFERHFNPSFYLAKNGHEFLNDKDIFISAGLDWDHSNYELLYWLKRRLNFKFVGVFYDAIPIVTPEHVHSTGFSSHFFNHFYNLNYLADKVYCISDFSRRQYLTVCKENQMPVKPILETFRLGDSTHNEIIVNENTSTPQQSYVLFVSTIESRKNHAVLLKAWLIAQKKNKAMPKLILVGMYGWGVESLFEQYRNHKYLKKNIEFKHHVNDIELSALYQNASFCVFPSFMEGWGLGAAESLSYGKICLVSTAPALIEATQGLMPAIAPNNAQGWVDLIHKIHTDSAYRSTLERTIKDHFKANTWENFSKEFFNFSLDLE